MIIDYDKMQETVIENFIGGEKHINAKMFVDEKNRILLGKLIPGASIGMHSHDTSSEIIYFLKGRGKVLTDAGEEAVCAGMCHYCPKGHSHSLINSGSDDLEFFAVVPQQ